MRAPLHAQDLVSSGVTDGILCDVGMPVMHRGGHIKCMPVVMHRGGHALMHRGEHDGDEQGTERFAGADAQVMGPVLCVPLFVQD